MRQEVLHIIDKYRMNIKQVSLLSGVSTHKVRCYIDGNKGDEQFDGWIEEAVIKWWKELFANRCRLLYDTSYAYLYCNEKTL